MQARYGLIVHPYEAFTREQGLTRVSARQYERLGTDAIAARAVEVATRGGATVGLCFDVDVLDAAFAPGSGADEPGGLTSRQVFDFVRLIAPHADLLWIGELNPLYDLHGVTAQVAAYVIFHLIAARTLAAADTPGH